MKKLFTYSMMKRVLPYLVLILIGAYLFNFAQDTNENIYYLDGNTEKNPLPISEIKKEKTIICSDCGMMLKNLSTSAQVVTPSGRTYFFDDIGCMVRWVNEHPFSEEVIMLVWVPEVTGYIDARLAWYIRDGVTPIGYGVVAYGTSMGALQSQFTFSAYESGYDDYGGEQEDGKEIYEFDEIKSYILRGETLLHPVVRKLILK
ncbi:MAG: copper chaperone NosL [Sulfurimonas sp.]|jgi:copper chaperone NosL